MVSHIRDRWDSGVRMYIQTGAIDFPSGYRRCFGAMIGSFLVAHCYYSRKGDA